MRNLVLRVVVSGLIWTQYKYNPKSFSEGFGRFIIEEAREKLFLHRAQCRSYILYKLNKTNLAAIGATEPKTYITRRVKDAAATRIQAVFRSYLARRALRALRSLVRLQALVRGNLVRKQTAAMVRRMHSLMVIQLRARVQRVQMTEEAHTPNSR
ncbi:hypothetical protein RND71_040984 [Anisodus tanguticus]|uniref:Uncharacterized protein n=1 Tax=Anisodus tanguticus TaxID=243964 RepID=A0AAE1QWH2_9SOLA|nr:hypothetical protein RND71_040984 [Anisodus tanguticus]